jgi:hypothetical protein
MPATAEPYAGLRSEKELRFFLSDLVDEDPH